MSYTTDQLRNPAARQFHEVPTTIPADGSALRHATTVDTVVALVDAQHAVEHPECDEVQQ